MEISKLNSIDLQAETYQNEFPEIYALKPVIENNPWHKQQSVFDHIAADLTFLEQALSGKSQLDQSLIVTINSYLEKTIGNQTRECILKAATLLHDNAKGMTHYLDKSTGIAQCPGHELVGATLVRNFQERLGFDMDSMEALERIVRYHGFCSDMVNMAVKTKDTEKYFRLFSQTVGNIAGETILLLYADDLGSDLEANDKALYDDRAKTIQQFLLFHFQSESK